MNVSCACHAPVREPLARVLTYAQDAQVGGVVEDSIEVGKIGRRLEGPRIGVWDQEAMKASADSQGNYLIGPERKQFDQVQAFVTAQKTLDLFEQAAGRKLPWAFESEQLGVGPHAGDGVNAYYQRFAESVSFYSFESKALGKRVQTSQSADIVAHETGHAILDGLKPQYGHTFDRETKGFHEAFGDCAAMLFTLTRASNRAHILNESGGDLSRENALSRTGEEFGKAVRLLNKDPKDDRDYLRTALNGFRYVDPASLPADGPRDVLSGEAHSFCQIWSNAFYGSIAAIFAQLRGQHSGDEALRRSGEIVAQLFTTGVQMASPARARYADIARAMLKADLLQGGLYQDALRSAFEAAAIPCADQPIPALAWQTPIANPQQAQTFLQENSTALQIDAGGYQGYRVQTGPGGLTFVEYLDHQTHLFGEVASDVRAGLTLTFDAAGQLVHLTRDPIDAGVLAAEGLGIQSELTRPQSDIATWRNGPGNLIEKLPSFICG